MPTINISIYQLNQNFTGRDTPGFPGGYDPTRSYRLHPRQRAEVWKYKHRESLLESIRVGRYIPPIIVNRVMLPSGKFVYDILDGGNRVSAFRRILDGGEFVLTDEERLVVNTATIEIVVLDGMTAEEIRKQFIVLNRSVRVSHGHLYHMSAEDSPIVRYAISIITDVDHPLHAVIVGLFTQNALTDSAAKGVLENVVALCAGAQYGEKHLTKSFDINEPILHGPVNADLINERLGHAFDVFRRANLLQPMEDGRKKRGNFSVGRYLGGIIYDLLPHGTPGTASYEAAPTNIEPILQKWARVIAAIHAEDLASDMALLATTVPGANNINPRKLRKMSKQVEFYLAYGRVPSAVELRDLVAHTVGDDASTESDDDDSVE